MTAQDLGAASCPEDSRVAIADQGKQSEDK